MASKFFNSIKNAFVTEVPDENDISVNKEVKTNDVKISNVVQQASVILPTSVTHDNKLEGQIDDNLLQKLCQVMEEANLPGPDYMELKNVSNNDEMKKAIPDESQRLMVAFITMKSSNSDLTKERVVNSINTYIEILEKERNSGHEQLQNIWKSKVEDEKLIVQTSQQRIVKLQKELEELVQFVQNKNNEIANASNECNVNKANFDATVDFLVKNLNEDKNKLNQILQ